MKFLIFAFLLSFGLAGTLFAEPTDQPAPRTKAYPWMTLEKWRDFHEGDLDRSRQGRIDVLFLGDSITEAWEKNGEKVWEKNFTRLCFEKLCNGSHVTFRAMSNLETKHHRVSILS